MIGGHYFGISMSTCIYELYPSDDNANTADVGFTLRRPWTSTDYVTRNSGVMAPH